MEFEYGQYVPGASRRGGQQPLEFKFMRGVANLLAGAPIVTLEVCGSEPHSSQGIRRSQIENDAKVNLQHAQPPRKEVSRRKTAPSCKPIELGDESTLRKSCVDHGEAIGRVPTGPGFPRPSAARACPPGRDVTIHEAAERYAA
jgi:hypothetical protein